MKRTFALFLTIFLLLPFTLANAQAQESNSAAGSAVMESNVDLTYGEVKSFDLPQKDASAIFQPSEEGVMSEPTEKIAEIRLLNKTEGFLTEAEINELNQADSSDNGGINSAPTESQQGAAIAAVLPDLTIKCLSVGGYNLGQLPANTPIPFTMRVENNTSVAANGAYLSVYVDSEKSTLYLGNFPAYSYMDLTIEVTFVTGTRRTVQMIVNEARTIAESNYDNNTYFTLVIINAPPFAADLAIYSASSVRGYSFPCREPADFTCVVVNYGPNACSPTLQILFDGSNIKQMTLPSLEPGYGITANLNITILVAGYHTIQFVVVNPSSCPDPDPSDNTRSVPVNLTYDLDLFAGKWSDASKLSVAVHPLATSAFSGTSAQLSSAITRWNGITSKVNFSVTFPTDGSMGNITTSSFDEPGDYLFGFTAGKCELYGSSGYISNPITDKTNYQYVFVLVNRNSSTFPTLSLSEQQQVIAHEFGHALGLMHPHNQTQPWCQNPSVMWYESTGPVTDYPSEHDKYNIKAKYP